jgi:Tfp pilus assembly protein PilE
VGAVLGAVAGVLSLFGWVNGRTQVLHSRINSTNDRLNEHAMNIERLETQQEANTAFQERTDDALAALRAQNTEQIRLLSELKGAIASQTQHHRRAE